MVSKQKARQVCPPCQGLGGGPGAWKGFLVEGSRRMAHHSPPCSYSRIFFLTKKDDSPTELFQDTTLPEVLKSLLKVSLCRDT